jgi:hypothetical protein
MISRGLWHQGAAYPRGWNRPTLAIGNLTASGAERILRRGTSAKPGYLLESLL